MLSVGIVGLPNVGKSSLFNALSRGGAAVSNYPFTTIESNVGVVPVPDERLDALARALAPEDVTPSAIRFVDIAGLVEGASEGEGLGNRFLGEIRTVDAVAHVVRCFSAGDVVHVLGEEDPVRDAKVVETELLLADLELVERTIARRSKQWQTRPEDHAAERSLLHRCRDDLEEGRGLRQIDLSPGELSQLDDLGLLTGKPLLMVVNVDEEHAVGEPPECVGAVREATGAPTVPVSAKIESELVELGDDDREEMMAALGMERSGLERLVEASFELLGLVRFYTVANDRLRAWAVPRGTKAPAAAGRIHSTMEEGFVKARVARWDEVVEAGGLHELQASGRLRVEGKSYEVEDGDVVEVLFTE